MDYWISYACGLVLHQEDVHLVSAFSDIFAGFRVSGNLETRKST